MGCYLGIYSVHSSLVGPLCVLCLHTHQHRLFGLCMWQGPMYRDRRTPCFKCTYRPHTFHAAIILLVVQPCVLPCVVQAGVSVTAWVFGHQLIDLVGLMLHPMLFFAWMYVLVLTPVPAWSYFTTLTAVSIYTSGLGYLVSGACRS